MTPWWVRLGSLDSERRSCPSQGRDIQDEKILGTIHVATGRDDHLGWKITPDLFKEHKNASHDDVPLRAAQDSGDSTSPKPAW
jgi:hypothetical protein